MLLVGGLGLVLTAGAGSARADGFEEAVGRLAGASYDETEAGIAGIAASGHARAVVVISALADGRLRYEPDLRTVFLLEESPEGEGSERLVDATTGEAVTGEPPAGLKPVRLNNRVRRAIEGALGSLQLQSSDRSERLEAASAVFKSRDEAVLPALDAAIANESDANVREVLAEARAAIVLAADDSTDADLLAAVETLAARGDQEAVALLATVPTSASPTVRAASESATASIERNLAVWAALQNVWYGISLGSVLLLAAIGLAITFGVMGVINMAHGEMVMLGAYVTFVVQEWIRNGPVGLFDWSLAIAVPAAFLVTGLIGVLIERGVIRHLYGRPLETLLATWGISLILQQSVRTAFGPSNREVGAPSWMSGTFDVGHLAVTYGRLWIVVFAGLVFVALLFILRFTRLGLEMRAVTQNRRMAAAMGIRTNRVDALTFGLGSAIAGIAGVALSQIDNVSPNLGQSYIIDSFLVVVFGGVGSLFGTLVGAMTLGVANKLLEPYAGAVLGKILLLVLIILFIQKRPRGLFALKGRAVES
jgi:urea transport system permease protein